MIRAYRLAGLKIESDLDLPDLPPWEGSAAVESDVAFRLGEVPRQLGTPDRIEPIFQTRGRDEYLLVLEGTGRILVRHGREVIIDAESGADPVNTRALLTGPVQAVLWHQRGLLPLHANTVVIAGRAIVLAGTSAAGTSALAAVLGQADHEILADNISVVDVQGTTAPIRVLSGVTWLRLWRDTLDLLGISANGLRPAVSEREKYFTGGWRVCAEPRELAAVIVLVRRSSIALAMQRLSGVAAFGALRDVVHMRRPANALGGDCKIFSALTRMLSAGVPVWRLALPDDLACLNGAATNVLHALERN